MTSNAMQVADGMAGASKASVLAVFAAVTVAGARLQRRAMANASGRPGPNAPTGDYRRSIGRQTTRTVASARSSVASSKPQARRLEFGFVGKDALGRSYNSSPFPHFGPAIDAEAPDFERDVGAALAEGHAT